VFENGEEILIRFRLFADQGAHGWGWAIDNLSIQGPVTDIEESFDRKFAVFPNPARQTITVELSETDSPLAEIRIISLQGQVVLTDQLQQEGNTLRKQVDISSLEEGIYIIKAECNGKVTYKKLLKLRP
jgi:hypothetical protein